MKKDTINEDYKYYQGQIGCSLIKLREKFTHKPIIIHFNIRLENVYVLEIALYYVERNGCGNMTCEIRPISYYLENFDQNQCCSIN